MSAVDHSNYLAGVALKDVTPPRMRCTVGACPALFKTNRGTYIVIGKRVRSPQIRGQLSSRVSATEDIFEVPVGLFDPTEPTSL